jgi:Ala-tRNA(Pro) deacylase
VRYKYSDLGRVFNGAGWRRPLASFCNTLRVDFLEGCQGRGATPPRGEKRMPMLQKLLSYLDENKVQYQRHSHPTAYTAKEVASVEHVPAHEIAKAVVFFSEKGYGMAVLPGDGMLDLHGLQAVLGVNRLRLATEGELADLFPDCELGAMGPFGNLCGLPVYVDESLASQEHIAFNAGTHRDVIHIRFDDFKRLANPAMVPMIRRAAA